MGARTTALTALIACRKQGAWSDAVLKDYIKRDRLDRRDAALASRLCYGVQQNRQLLDYYLAQFIRGGLKKQQPVVLDILRIGAYQILFLDRIPASAAVNEAVNMAKKQAGPKVGGFVNGVLRSLLREKEHLTPPEDLATRYSHPAELVALLRENVGDEELEPLLKAHNEAPPTTIQCNLRKATAQQLVQALEESGAVCTPNVLVPDCFDISGAGNLETLQPYRDGWFYTQDAAARLAVKAAGLRPGMTVLDACAAPGGKSFGAAMDMEDRGEIISCDIHPHKIGLIEAGRDRLGITCLTARVQDASARCADFVERFDTVIADVPCSGLGVIRKKPDIRYKDLTQLEGLPAVQTRILENVSAYVKPGGVLLYATCTILKRENEEIIRAFLTSHGEFSLEHMDIPMENDGFVTLLPSRNGTDGFFICKLRRHP
jgi:16S rRNA (cytosine967-C5)-methyltransferase